MGGGGVRDRVGGGLGCSGWRAYVASKILSRECNQKIVVRQDHLVLSTELISLL